MICELRRVNIDTSDDYFKTASVADRRSSHWAEKTKNTRADISAESYVGGINAKDYYCVMTGFWELSLKCIIGELFIETTLNTKTDTFVFLVCVCSNWRRSYAIELNSNIVIFPQVLNCFN